jgi:uncharacterized protein
MIAVSLWRNTESGLQVCSFLIVKTFIMTDKDARTWSAIIHLGGLAGMIIHIGFANLIGVLVLWLIKRNESAFVDEQGKEAVNFQIMISILFIILGIISGIFFLGRIAIHWYNWNSFTWHWHNYSLWEMGGAFGLVQLFNLIFCIVAAIRAGRGEHYRYPISLRLVR